MGPYSSAKFGVVLISIISSLALLPLSAQQDHLDEGEGSLRVIGGRVEGTGDLLIRHDGRWGLICDDNWNKASASIACRMLGYPSALGHTTQSYFGSDDSEYDILLDDVMCYGDEASLLNCRHATWGEHDCSRREAAGVFCEHVQSTTLQPGLNVTEKTTPKPPTRPGQANSVANGNSASQAHLEQTPMSEEHIEEIKTLRKQSRNLVGNHQRPPKTYSIRLVGGRNEREGRVEVRIGSKWGTICSDHWRLLEANVVCKQLNLGYAQMAVTGDSFQGADVDKVFSGIECQGTEEHLAECLHHQMANDVVCKSKNQIAGVICTLALPDLVPNATLVQVSAYLEDRPMIYLQCALEENCASSSAFTIQKNQEDWLLHRRRLLRFSSSTWNFGTADFRPLLRKDEWEWHLCHMHYHSMDVFASYDLLDLHGNRIAEGHKASFCLEDVECLPGVEKHYACKGFGDQGISVGCADNYLHDIDCQWIDVTDVDPGDYIFKMHINPDFLIAEISYENNAVTCKVKYTGYQLFVTNCRLG